MRKKNLKIVFDILTQQRHKRFLKHFLIEKITHMSILLYKSYKAKSLINKFNSKQNKYHVVH